MILTLATTLAAHCNTSEICPAVIRSYKTWLLWPVQVRVCLLFFCLFVYTFTCGISFSKCYTCKKCSCCRVSTQTFLWFYFTNKASEPYGSRVGALFACLALPRPRRRRETVSFIKENENFADVFLFFS